MYVSSTHRRESPPPPPPGTLSIALLQFVASCHFFLPSASFTFSTQALFSTVVPDGAVTLIGITISGKFVPAATPWIILHESVPLHEQVHPLVVIAASVRSTPVGNVSLMNVVPRTAASPLFVTTIR